MATGVRVGLITMITLRLLLLALTLSAVSAVRAASPAPADRNERDPSPVATPRLPAGRLHSVLFAAIDLDHNGVLSAAEMARAPTVLRALDLNQDGVLSADELRRFELSHPVATTDSPVTREPRVGRLSPGFVLAFTLDANHDGVIQAMEMANAAMSLKALDTNGDGQLTLRELRPDTAVSQNGL